MTGKTNMIESICSIGVKGCLENLKTVFQGV